jgi:hypothetical protein
MYRSGGGVISLPHTGYSNEKEGQRHVVFTLYVHITMPLNTLKLEHIVDRELGF